MSPSMSRKWASVVFLLVGMATDLVHGQLPYSSNTPAYEVPPLGVIHAYQRHLEDDIYAVERKAEYSNVNDSTRMLKSDVSGLTKQIQQVTAKTTQRILFSVLHPANGGCFENERCQKKKNLQAGDTSFPSMASSSASVLGHRECVAGHENFLFCPLVLNIFDFAACTINPATAQGADALIRGIKFPSSAFSQTPSVAVGISGVGTGLTCDIKVEAKDVYASGFNIEITGGFLFYPHFIDVVWIACPVRQKVNTTVRDFVPKKGVPPPPYFPISYASGSSSKARSNTSSNGNNLVYDNNEPRYADSKPGYEESSVPVDEESYDNKKPSPKSTLYKTPTSSYVKSTPQYDEDKPPRKEAAPDDDSRV